MELFVDDRTHDINIHFRSRCGARDLGSNFRPMGELAGIAIDSGPRRATLRLIVSGALVEKNEHLRVPSPAAPDCIPLFEPSSDGLQHSHILRLFGQSCRDFRQGWTPGWEKTRITGLQLRRQPDPGREPLCLSKDHPFWANLKPCAMRMNST